MLFTCRFCFVGLDLWRILGSVMALTDHCHYNSCYSDRLSKLKRSRLFNYVHAMFTSLRSILVPIRLFVTTCYYVIGKFKMA
ncbi:hypothetical protein CARUB_v10021229mg [Capsella rubella]|uniref:Secreted protein n=1 Tax=Capsella rubella TaxID=81985 RepID=R0GJM9_9BRAS|nr:hypothetical protein CARUB_v10021229mg [Capsella rubella]